MMSIMRVLIQLATKDVGHSGLRELGRLDDGVAALSFRTVLFFFFLSSF